MKKRMISSALLGAALVCSLSFASLNADAEAMPMRSSDASESDMPAKQEAKASTRGRRIQRGGRRIQRGARKDRSKSEVKKAGKKEKSTAGSVRSRRRFRRSSRFHHVRGAGAAKAKGAAARGTGRRRMSTAGAKERNLVNKQVNRNARGAARNARSMSSGRAKSKGMVVRKGPGAANKKAVARKVTGKRKAGKMSGKKQAGPARKKVKVRRSSKNAAAAKRNDAVVQQSAPEELPMEVAAS